ncbi:Maf family protein [Propionimicrobium lymphophilum]|uniref:Maf family protein n=1 Tax=Propionimicrobium lymphophilum TaxID=33012 RepID=UPI0023F3C965|nr:Maf family protein [Propionimicrobium lymphophilum]
MKLILASSSPARRKALENCGISPRVIKPLADESYPPELSCTQITTMLARRKGEHVLKELDVTGDFALISCDTMLDVQGTSYGKPGSKEKAVKMWQRMRGRTGVAHTGHFVVVRRHGKTQTQCREATTLVYFADLSDEEIEAYVATGEPERVAGGFTIDALGGAFITGIEGDPWNVAGISLPLVRQMLIDMNVGWHQLWED